MIGRFLARFGVGALAVIIGALGDYVGAYDFSELGVASALVAAAAAILAGLLAKARDKVKEKLEELEPNQP